MVDFDRAVFSGGTVSFDGAARPELAGTAAAPANICATGRRAASSPDPYGLAFSLETTESPMCEEAALLAGGLRG
jgi:hypothetical protein